MIGVIQRVRCAAVHVASEEVAAIDQGLLVLLGVQKGDGPEDIDYLVRKIAGLRIFNDEEGKMNRSLEDPAVQGAVLAVSQFTLLGDVRKGRRPSFDRAEQPDRAEALFNRFIQALQDKGLDVSTGIFGAMMEVSLVNDGPVTLYIDSHDRPRK